MNAAHRFHIIDAKNPEKVWLTASTRAWAELKVDTFRPCYPYCDFQILDRGEADPMPPVTPTDIAEIRRAVDFLSAARMPDGRYQYFASETREHYAVSESDIADLGRQLLAGGFARDVYSVWCADTEAQIVGAR